MAADLTAGPHRSLRREWSRAFRLMLALLLAASLFTFVAVRHIVGEFGGTANRLARQTTTITTLSGSLVRDENNAHAVVDGTLAGGIGSYLVSQQALFRAFDLAATEFPSGSMAATLTEARTTWQTTLMTAGLRGGTAQSFVSPAAGSAAYGALQSLIAAGGLSTVRSLDDLQTASLLSVHTQLSQDADVERGLLAALGTLFFIAFAVTVYLRRRMASDLLKPVAALHDGVSRLNSGVYDTPIAIHRDDELGELATAFNDMTAGLRESHLALDFRANHDSLTGMPNRASLLERLAASFASGADRRAHQDSVLFIDIDDFKIVNDTLGHEGGDDLLTAFAARLTACVRPLDMVARLGGDEFAIVVVEQGLDGAASIALAERILDAVRAPFLIDGAALTVSVSIGLTQHRPDTADPAELLRQADFAMYMAKGSGKNRYEVFSSDMHHQMIGRANLKSELATAVTSGELRLEYQPISDLGTGEVVGVEALVRWQHPTLGLLTAPEFMPLAAQTGDAGSIGCWVIGAAARQVAGWRHSMPHCADLWVAVNLSAFHLPGDGDNTAIDDVLADLGTEAAALVLEVTEDALSEGVEGRAEALNVLRRHGVRIGIDDFGAGVASLTALNAVRADGLRLDRTLASTSTVAMLEGILGLAGRLHMTVIANGVETLQERDRLRSLGCRFGQGSLLAGPTTPSDMEALLAAGGLLPHDEPLRPLPSGPASTPRQA